MTTFTALMAAAFFGAVVIAGLIWPIETIATMMGILAILGIDRGIKYLKRIL